MRAQVEGIIERRFLSGPDTVLHLGDYAAAKAFVEQYSVRGPRLESDLERLAEAGIPVDVVFEQGPEVLGLR